MTIGQRIGELRKSYGYSQEYIAEKMNVSRQAVSKWEQDLSAPDTYNLIALAELLDVSVFRGVDRYRGDPDDLCDPVSGNAQAPGNGIDVVDNRFIVLPLCHADAGQSRREYTGRRRDGSQ